MSAHTRSNLVVPGAGLVSAAGVLLLTEATMTEIPEPKTAPVPAEAM